MDDHPQFKWKKVQEGSNAIICEIDTILQTWYNQTNEFKGTHVVVGSYGIVCANGTVDWKRGDDNTNDHYIDNCIDICDHAIKRKKINENDDSYVIDNLDLYTWLEKDGKIYDVTRPEWTGQTSTIINGIPKVTLFREKGYVYRQFGTNEIEQPFTLKILEDIYRPFDFSKQ